MAANFENFLFHLVSHQILGKVTEFQRMSYKMVNNSITAQDIKMKFKFNLTLMGGGGGHFPHNDTSH